jgi:hypothetical protein
LTALLSFALAAEPGALVTLRAQGASLATLGVLTVIGTQVLATRQGVASPATATLLQGSQVAGYGALGVGLVQIGSTFLPSPRSKGPKRAASLATDGRRVLLQGAF